MTISRRGATTASAPGGATSMTSRPSLDGFYDDYDRIIRGR